MIIPEICKSDLEEGGGGVVESVYFKCAKEKRVISPIFNVEVFFKLHSFYLKLNLTLYQLNHFDNQGLEKS